MSSTFFSLFVTTLSVILSINVIGAANYEYNPRSSYNLTFTIYLDMYPHETSWTIANNETMSLIIDGNGNNVSEYTVITETALITDDCYLLTIYDSFGNGLKTNGC